MPATQEAVHARIDEEIRLRTPMAAPLGHTARKWSALHRPRWSGIVGLFVVGETLKSRKHCALCMSVHAVALSPTREVGACRCATLRHQKPATPGGIITVCIRSWKVVTRVPGRQVRPMFSAHFLFLHERVVLRRTDRWMHSSVRDYTPVSHSKFLHAYMHACMV